MSLGVITVSRRANALTASGAVAAAVIGTAAIAAGWSWGALLLAMFVSASALSKVGQRKKAARVDAIVAKGGKRDAYQVMANGGLFAVAAVGYLFSPATAWFAIAAGSLAASAADTWATEVGTLSRVEPVYIVNGRRVPPGTSGGITLAGTASSVAGALFIAAVAASTSWPTPFAAIAVGGFAGALSDSILGGTVQARRWCELCAKGTERFIHDCGATTRPAGGIPGFNNDLVNAACSAIGALVALLMS
jgi:uncharacterized protein (TIGR00297 family)